MFKRLGEICYLTPFEEKHLSNPDYLNWLRDYDVVKTLNKVDYIRPVSYAEVTEYCHTVMRSQEDMFLAIHCKDKSDFIGTLRVSRINWHNKTADIGIMIGNKEYWGRGIATDAIRIVCSYLFNECSLRRLTCGMMANNIAMEKAFSNVGFKREGVFRKHDFFESEYIDHIYMGCFQDEFVNKIGKLNYE